MSLIDELTRSKNLSNVPFDFIMGSVETLNLESIERRQIDRFTWKIWDGREKVNGQSYEDMAEAGIVFPQNGTCYLIRDSNRGEYIYFQTFDPQKQGVTPMDHNRAEGLAKRLCEDLAKSSTLRILEKHVEESYRKA